MSILFSGSEYILEATSRGKGDEILVPVLKVRKLDGLGKMTCHSEGYFTNIPPDRGTTLHLSAPF